MNKNLLVAGVVTNNHHPNSRAFNCPLLAAREALAARGLKLRFCFNEDLKNGLCGLPVLLINSNVFRPLWAKQKELIFDFFERARKAGTQRILWFDTTDSTRCSQFEALPFVDGFYKSQLLKDRNLYLTPPRCGRIFADYFDDFYKSGEPAASDPPPDASLLPKLELSWNTCFENYTESRYTLFARFIQKLRPILFRWRDEKFMIEFSPVKVERQKSVSCRVGLNHSRPAIVAHRKAIVEKLATRGVSCEKLPLLSDYFAELRNSRIGVGPFGLGEITLRDFEIIICGATLLKPDMGHMQTWPELFRPGESYMPHRWDLADFDEKIDELLANSELRERMALRAQEIYREAISPAGLETFAGRIAKMAGL